MSSLPYTPAFTSTPDPLKRTVTIGEGQPFATSIKGNNAHPPLHAWPSSGVGQPDQLYNRGANAATGSASVNAPVNYTYIINGNTSISNPANFGQWEPLCMKKKVDLDGRHEVASISVMNYLLTTPDFRNKYANGQHNAKAYLQDWTPPGKAVQQTHFEDFQLGKAIGASNGFPSSDGFSSSDGQALAMTTHVWRRAAVFNYWQSCYSDHRRQLAKALISEFDDLWFVLVRLPWSLDGTVVSGGKQEYFLRWVPYVSSSGDAPHPMCYISSVPGNRFIGTASYFARVTETETTDWEARVGKATVDAAVYPRDIKNKSYHKPLLELDKLVVFMGI